MKKWVFAFLLATLIPLVSACVFYKEEATFDDPAFLDFAGRLTLNASTKADASAVGDIVSFELTESGLYVIGRLADTEGNVTYTAGHYSVSGSDYLLDGFGKLSFDNSETGNVELTITSNNGQRQTIPARLTKPKDQNVAYRAWIVEKTRVTTFGWTPVSAEFTGCSFPEIAAFLRANSHKVPDNVPDLDISTLSFTGTEAVIFIYDDNTADMGTFSLSGNVFHYDWERADGGLMGFTFETEESIIEYQDGKCVLTINGKIKNSTTSGSVTFLMSPYD